MFPWDSFPPGTPQADPANYRWDPATDSYYPVGPAAELTYDATLPPPDYGGEYNYDAAEPYGTTTYDTGYALPPVTPLGGAAEEPQHYRGNIGVGNQSWQVPAEGYGMGLSPHASPPAPAPVGYATTPAGDDFTVDAQRFAEYEQYLNDFGAGIAPGVPAENAPSAGAVTGATALAPVYDASGNVVYDTGTGSGGYDTGYGDSSASGGYPAPYGPPAGGFASGMGGGFPFAGGFGGGFGMDRSGLAQPGDPRFDPFAWSGTANPSPPPVPAHAGSPSAAREMILEALQLGARMEQERAAAQQPRMSATNYALHRLGLTQPEQPEPTPPPPAYAPSAFERAPRLGESTPVQPRFRPRGFVT